MLALRVFGFALLSSLAASALLLFVVGAGGEPGPHALASLLTWHGLLEFLSFLLVAVLPASFPMTLVGAWLAARAAARQQHRQTLRFWLFRAFGAGAALASLGSLLWFGGINASYMWDASWSGPPPGMLGPGRGEDLAFIAFMSGLGGVAGACVGGVVGLFCWQATRGLPQKDASELTRHG